MLVTLLVELLACSWHFQFNFQFAYVTSSLTLGFVVQTSGSDLEFFGWLIIIDPPLYIVLYKRDSCSSLLQAKGDYNSLSGSEH